ncbi:hypothetical protein V8J88_21150 [Massilia sp. W12]|uniref:hypothetical protein n=1 Tax=Massilia sp. W12 TaxID=3126507 RepID=UPI0030D57B5F
MPMNENAINGAYNLLLSNPVRFLRTWPLRLAGGASNCQLNFELYDNKKHGQRPGTVFGYKAMKDTDVLRVDVKGGSAVKDVIKKEFTAHNLPMQALSDTLTFTELGENGKTLMLTSQLNGCAIVIKQGSGDKVLIAHVQPHSVSINDDASSKLTEILKSRYEDAQVYGNGKGNQCYDRDRDYCAVVGVRNAQGQWRVYSQEYGNGNNVIHRVVQLWPAFSEV